MECEALEMENPAAIKELCRIPGVGPSIARDLIDLGITSVAALRKRNAQMLYDDLIRLRGGPIDRCVLYVFRCAIYFASESNPEPEKLKWWKWKDRKIP